MRGLLSPIKISMAASLVIQIILFLLPYAIANPEGDALYALRRAVGDPEKVLQSWDPNLVDPCTWFHVTCDHLNRVIRLDLGNAGLAGPLVPDLGKLKFLKYMELYMNNLTGEIPKEIGLMRSLVSLDLYHNDLTGSIPSSISTLPNLRFLRLNQNKLTGRIPTGLNRLPSLKILDLSSNDLCGTIPMSGSFSVFTETSFQNNPRLEGPQLLGLVNYHSGDGGGEDKCP